MRAGLDPSRTAGTVGSTHGGLGHGGPVDFRNFARRRGLLVQAFACREGTHLNQRLVTCSTFFSHCACALLISAGLAAQPAPVAPGTPSEKAEAFFVQLHAKGEFNGNVLIADGSEIVLHTAYGLANEATGEKLTRSTPHRIASVTKGFTAVLALQAAERREIDLDSPLLSYFPEVEAPALAAITLRHLLNHTSGLVEFAPALGEGETLGNALARGLKTAAVSAEPGAKFSYVNVGYTLVAHVLERATKKSYAELLQQRILQPAGMTATHLDHGESDRQTRAAGYQIKDGAVVPEEEPDLARFLGAGNLVSTTEDLYRFSRALASDALLSPASRTLLKTPQLQRYAMGCAIMTPGSGETVQLFLGNMPGTSAVLARFNDDQRTVIILSNRYNVPLNRLVPQLHRLLSAAP